MTEYFSGRWDSKQNVLIHDRTVMTIGTFDGIHRGHREVIDKVRNRAEAVAKKSCLVTFRPHPLSVLSPDKAPEMLTTYEEKKEILSGCGIDYVAFIPFDKHLSIYEPRRFVEDFLVDRFGLSELIVGYDHRFGKGGAGDASLLEKLGKEMDFSVEVMSPVLSVGKPISSSKIRGALSGGDVKSAKDDLGRLYSFVGEVVTGSKRGRDLGFPTANMKIIDKQDEVKLLPLEGIYAVKAHVGEEEYMGALHIGPRPTFGDSDKMLELYIIDFKGDIYNTKVKVELVEYLRGIVSFESTEDLIAQMDRDVKETRKILEENVSE